MEKSLSMLSPLLLSLAYLQPKCTMCCVRCALCTIMFVLRCACSFARNESKENNIYIYIFFGYVSDGRWIVCRAHCSIALFLSVYCASIHWPILNTLRLTKFRLIGFSANRSVVLTQHTSLEVASYFANQIIQDKETNKKKNVRHTFMF